MRQPGTRDCRQAPPLALVVEMTAGASGDGRICCYCGCKPESLPTPWLRMVGQIKQGAV
jgi:hypothetical protein